MCFAEGTEKKFQRRDEAKKKVSTEDRMEVKCKKAEKR
jgi:hypothetical protein